VKKRIGCYPRVRVEGGGRGAVSQAGAVLLVETVRKTGLHQALSAAFAPWRKARAVHDPGKVLLDVALAVALGGDCLADVAMVRAEPAVFGPVASDPTVSRLVDTLAAGGILALTALTALRAAVRESLEASLRRLKTDRVDLLWAHAPDYATPIEEIKRCLLRVCAPGHPRFRSPHTARSSRRTAASACSRKRFSAPKRVVKTAAAADTRPSGVTAVSEVVPKDVPPWYQIPPPQPSAGRQARPSP
jgi:hypothetical protein